MNQKAANIAERLRKLHQQRLILDGDIQNVTSQKTRRSVTRTKKSNLNDAPQIPISTTAAAKPISNAQPIPSTRNTTKTRTTKSNLTSNVTSNAVSSTRTRKIADSKKEIIDEEPKIENKPKISARKAIADQQPNTKQTYFSYSRKNIISTEEKAQAPKVQTRASNLNNNNITNAVSTKYSQHKQKLEIKPETKPIIERNNNISLTSKRRTELKRNVEAVPSYEFRQKNPEPALNAKIRNEKVTEAYTRIKPTTINVSDSDSSGSSDELIKQAAAFLSRAKKPSPNSTLTSRVDISPSQSPVSSQRNLAPSFNNKSPSPLKESSNAPFSWGNMLKESINESKVLIKNTQNKNKPSFDNDNESDSIVTNSTKQINPIKDQSPHNNYQYSSQSNKQNPVQISTQNRFHANHQTNTSDNSEIDFIFTPQKDQHNEIENKFDDHNINLDAENEESPYIKQIKSRIHHSKPPIQKQSWKDFLPEEKLQKEETKKEPVLKSKKTTGIPKFVPKKKQRMFESSDSTSVDEFLRLEETTKDNNSNEEQPKHVKKFVSTIQKKVANIFNTDSNDKSQSSDVLPEFEEERHFVSKSKIISKNQPINYENESESINISESEDEKPLPQVSVVRNPNSRFSQFIQKTESNSPLNNQLSRFAQSTTKQFNSPKNSDTNNNKTSKFSNEDDEDNDIEIIMEDSNVSASVKINNISKSTSSPTVSSKTNSSSNNSLYNYRNSNNIEDEVEEMPGFTITNNSKSPIQAIQEFQALKQSVLDSLQEDEEITKAALKINPKSNPKLNSNLSPTSFSISNTFQTKSPIHTETNLTIQDDDNESDGIPVPKTILPKPETKYTSSFLNSKFTPSTSIPTSITTITSSDDDGSDDDIPISKKSSQQKSVSTHDFSTSENDDEISILKKKSPQLENKFASNLLNSKFNNHINNAGNDSEDDIPIPKKTTPHSETKFDTDFLNSKFTDDADDSDDSIPVPKKKSPQPETKFDQNLLNSSSDGENYDIPIPKRKIPQPEKSVNDMIFKVDSEEEETNSIHQPNNLPTTENNIIQNSIIDNDDELSDFIPQPKKLPKPEIMLYSNLKNTETKDNNSYDSIPKPKTSPKPEKKPYNNISNYQLDDSNSDTRSYTSKQSFQKITTKDSFEVNDEEETLPESKPLPSKQYQFSDDSSDIEQTVNLKHENNYEISSDEELDPKLNNAQNKDASIWDSKVYSDSNIEIYDDTNEARENVKTFNNSASGSPSITKANNNNKIITHLEEEEEEGEDSFIARHKYAKSAIANLNRTKKQSSMFSNLSSENIEKEEINKEDEKYSEEEEELVSSKVTNNDISEISLKNDYSSFKDPSPSPLALTQKAQSPKSPLRQIVQQMAEAIGFDLNEEEEEPVDSYFLNSDAKSNDDFDDSHADDLMKRIDNAISKSESLITDTIKSTAKPLSEDINHSSNEIESHNSQVLTNFTQENEEEIKEAITKKKEIDYEKIDFESIKNKIYNDDDFSKKFGLSDDDEEEDEILAKIQKGRNFNFSDEKMKLSTNFLNHSDNSEEEDEILSRLKEKSQKFNHRQKEGDNEEEEFNESDKETQIEEEDVEEKVQNSKIKNKFEDNNQDKVVGKDDDEPILKIDTIELTADKDSKIEEEEDLFNFNEDEPSLNQNESSFALDFLHQKDFLEPIRRNTNKTLHSKQTENELESEEEESFQFNQNKSKFDELEEEEIHEFQNLDILNSQNEQQKLQNNSIVSNSDEFIKRLQEENSKNNLIASDDDDNEFLKKLRSFRDDYTSSKVKKVTTTDLNEDEEEEEIDERTQTHVQMDSDDYIIHTENRKTHGSSVKSSPVGKFLSDSQQNNDMHESKIDENEDDEYDSDNILRELQKRIAIGSNNALSKKKSYLDSDSDDDENDKEVEEFQRKTRELIEKNDQNNLNDNDFTNKQTFNIQALKTEIRGMNFTDLDIDNSDIDLNSSDMNEKGDDNLDKEIDDFINLKDSDSDDDISI